MLQPFRGGIDCGLYLFIRFIILVLSSGHWDLFAEFSNEREEREQRTHPARGHTAYNRAEWGLGCTPRSVRRRALAGRERPRPDGAQRKARGTGGPAPIPGAPPPSALGPPAKSRPAAVPRPRAGPCCLDYQSDAFSLATSAAPAMADEEEITAQTEKVNRIQRVFINLLDSYSSRNIGKVSGCSQQNPSPQPPIPRPRSPHRRRS